MPQENTLQEQTIQDITFLNFPDTKKDMPGYEKKSPSRELILDSWRRSMDYGIRQDSVPPNLENSPEKFEQLLLENEQLLQFASQEMDRLSNKLYKGDFIIAVTDAEGTLLKYVCRNNSEYYASHPWFQKGSCWSEENAGTNAVALALLTRESCFLRGDEHYLPLQADIHCFATPVFLKGENLAGSLALISKNDKNININIRITELINSARLIEQRLVSAPSQNHDGLNVQIRNMAEMLSEGVIITDEDNTKTFANEYTGKLFHIDMDLLTGSDLAKIIPESNIRFWNAMDSEGGPDSMLIPVRYSKMQAVNTQVRIYPLADLYKSSFPHTYGSASNGRIIMLRPTEPLKSSPASARSNGAKTCFDDLIGESRLFRDAIEQAKMFAHTDLNILLLGETGVGKDLFAQCIHNESNRYGNPYFAMNCAAIPSELLASELFGYVEGSFTGAKRGGNPGKLEITRGGTLLLDEIGDMPFDLQAYLLRAIDSREITRIGGSEIIEVDSRIIAATNIDINDAVKEKKFRADLFYRLGNTVVHIPPLRERREDIPLMAERFVDIAYHKLEHRPVSISPAFMDTLAAYDFPGNVRELKNIIASSVILSRSDVLEESCLPLFVRQPKRAEEEAPLSTRFEHEREMLLSYLKKYNYNKSKAADALNMSRSTLYRKMQQHGL